MKSSVFAFWHTVNEVSNIVCISFRHKYTCEEAKDLIPVYLGIEAKGVSFAPHELTPVVEVDEINNKKWWFIS